MNRPLTAARPKRTLLWLLVLLFFAPLLLSFVVYYGSNWRPAGRTNHGALIEPAQTLQQIALPRVDLLSNAAPQPAAANVLTGKWSLLYIGDGSCATRCAKALYFMHQTHLSLGNLIPRVQRVWLAPAHCCLQQADSETQPALIALDAAGVAAQPLLTQFPQDLRESSIFIVDPRGNLMMRYDVGADPKGLREDLKKLLNLSHIG